MRLQNTECLYCMKPRHVSRNHMRQTLFILLLFVCGASYSQKMSLEGHWRRIHAPVKNTTKDKVPMYGDFIFKSDSTFIMVGDSTAANSEIPSWNVGEELNGKWSHSKNSLCLKIQDLQIPLCYKVLKLSAKELVLINAGSGSGKMKFIRLYCIG